MKSGGRVRLLQTPLEFGMSNYVKGGMTRENKFDRVKNVYLEYSQRNYSVRYWFQAQLSGMSTNCNGELFR